MPTGRG